MGEIRIKRDVSDAIVYGIHINPNIQDPSNAVTYLEDAVGMTPASMGSTSFNAGSWADAFFIPKPCMVRYDGIVDYYLDPSDYSKKADGTASDIADPNYAGNAMMEWGLIWFKFEPGEADGEGYFYVSNKKVDDSFNCWCNYDANNSITQHFYTAIYNGTGTDKLRSISGVQLTPANGSGNTTGQQEISRATANNTSDMTEWYIDLWADRILLTGLLYLMGKSLNLQDTFGRGLDSGGQTAKESYVTGTLNDKGLFWGATNSGNSAVKVFGMENFWGCAWRRTAGLFGTPTGYAYKLTHGTVDGSTVTEFGTNANGYIPVTVARPNDGYISKMLFGKHGMLPSAVGGTSSTYYSDYFYNGTGFSLVGGVSAHGSGCGFSVSLGNSVGVVSWSAVAALSLKPRAKTPYNPDWDNRPAHQFINGEWIDIPTHTMTANGWQGELTSQSPLKFWADGDMLDWRIEGASGGVGDWDEAAQKYKIPVNVKGGTLFDISDTYSAIPSKYNITNDTIFMVLTTDWGANFIKFDKTYEAGTYTFRANITKDSNMTISLWSDKSFVGSSYNSYYKGYARAFNGSLQTYTFSEDFRIGFTGSGAIGLSGSISDFQILKGTYTSETMPPYESYITNLYTDHQLMDGDSIDFTTDQTTIPLAMGNNILTIDTAVQPKSVFVKFEG